jgi:hypothetical protein
VEKHWTYWGFLGTFSFGFLEAVVTPQLIDFLTQDSIWKARLAIVAWIGFFICLSFLIASVSNFLVSKIKRFEFKPKIESGTVKIFGVFDTYEPNLSILTPIEAFASVQDSYIKALDKLIKNKGQHTAGTSRFEELKKRSSDFLSGYSKTAIDLEADFSRFHQHRDELPGWILERLQYAKRNMGFHDWQQPLPDVRVVLLSKFNGYTWPGAQNEK